MITENKNKKENRKLSKLTDNEVVQKLAGCGLTNKEIADVMNITEHTVKSNFDIFLTKGRVNLKERLKRKQISVAMSGNVSMLIWLGKQYLDQKDQNNDTGELTIMVKRKELELNENN